MNPTHIYEVFEGRWAISFAFPGTVLDRDWDDFIQALERAENLEFAIGVSLGTVTINSVQRKKAADILKKRGAFAVVITDDRLTRGIATAVSWFGVNVKAFAWNDIDGALKAVKAPADVEERMKKSILAFRDRVNQANA